jgi:hypothetical protein
MQAASTASTAPSKHVNLLPDAFASDWDGRPDAEVAIGLRLLSLEDTETAINLATRRAREWMTDTTGHVLDKRSFDEVRNDQLISILVARSACDPNDTGTPYFGQVAEDVIRHRLNVVGCRRLWDEICKMHVTIGVGMPVADDDEVRLLAGILARGAALAAAEPSVVTELRKLCAYALEQLGPLDPGDEATTDQEAGVYAASGSLGV